MRRCRARLLPAVSRDARQAAADRIRAPAEPPATRADLMSQQRRAPSAATCWFVVAPSRPAPRSGHLRDTGSCHQQRRVDVILVEAAVLGQLRATGEDHAGVHLQDDVRRARIDARIVELVAQRRRRRISPGCRGPAGSPAVLRLATTRGRQRRVGQPDQRAIVGDIERIRAADGGRRLSAADAAALADIDRRLAVLGADDDQRSNRTGPPSSAR